MPLVHVYLHKGHSPEYLTAVGNAIHEALVSAAGAPADGRFQVIHQMEPGELIAHPSYGGVSRSADVIVLQITLKVGRPVDMKKALYAGLVRRLGEAVDLRPDDLVVSLIEIPGENWSFGNGVATYV